MSRGRQVDYLADRLKEVNQTFKVHVRSFSDFETSAENRRPQQVPLATSREDFFASLKPGSDLDSLRVIYYSNFTARLLQADKELISHLPPSCIVRWMVQSANDSQLLT